MDRKTLSLSLALLLAGSSVTFAGFLLPQDAGQVSKDRSAVKSDASNSVTDEKDVKQLSAQAGQAEAKSRQARAAWMQKTQARQAAVKSYGAKDSRSQQAYKDEASAKEEYQADMKAQQSVEAQRKAAIEKLHSADTAYNSDSHKLSGDEGQKHTTSKKTSTTSTKQ